MKNVITVSEITGPYWLVFGCYETEKFLRSLKIILPGEAVLYFEGCSITHDIKTIYSRFSFTPQIPVKRSTHFPKPSFYHITFTDEAVETLCEGIPHHAQPELFDHFKAYVNDAIIIAALDFGGDDEPFMISGRIPEETVRSFCESIDCRYRKYE